MKFSSHPRRSPRSFPQFHRRGLENNNCKNRLAEPKSKSCLTVDGAHKSRCLETHNTVLQQSTFPVQFASAVPLVPSFRAPPLPQRGGGPPRVCIPMYYSISVCIPHCSDFKIVPLIPSTRAGVSVLIFSLRLGVLEALPPKKGGPI